MGQRQNIILSVSVPSHLDPSMELKLGSMGKRKDVSQFHLDDSTSELHSRVAQGLP